MCDCSAIDTDVIKYAGIYCEHAATSYCQKGSDKSAHAFCTNGGECKFKVDRKESHAGCKCKPGYTGNYCQFIEGSMPSDWNVGDFMHPAITNPFSSQGIDTGGVVGIVVGAALAVLLIAGILAAYLYGDTAGKRLIFRRPANPFNRKEMDTATNGTDSASSSPTNNIALGGRRTSTIKSSDAEFIGGKSVYKKKTSTGAFAVTPDTLEADGGVLTEALDALDDMAQAAGDGEDEGGMRSRAGTLEEVDLDEDEPAANGTMA